MEILFQTVVSGYLLHFVQDGSSKNALGKSCLRKNNKHPEFGKTIRLKVGRGGMPRPLASGTRPRGPEAPP